MYKEILIFSIITEELKYTDTLVSVSEDVADLIANSLDEGDWTYLLVKDKYKAELLKITAVVSGMLYVHRGWEKTHRGSFSAGSKIVFTPTISSILDSSYATLLSLSFSDAVNIRNGKISIPKLQIIGVGGTLDGLPIKLKEDALCCGPNSPPDIPMEFFKLRVLGKGLLARSVDDGSYRVYK